MAASALPAGRLGFGALRANAGAGEITWRRVRFPLGGSVSAR